MTDQTQANEPRNPLRLAWRKSRPGLIVVGILSLFINALRFATAIYILQILDRVIGSGSVETLIMLTIITVIAVSFGFLMEVVRRQLLIAWGNWLVRFFGPPMFAAGLQDDSYTRLKISGSLRDVSTLRGFVAGEGLVAWLDVFWAPIFVAATFLVSPLLGYILLAGCLLILLLGALSEIFSRDFRETSYSAGKDAQTWINTAERHHETVSSLNIIRNFANRWCDSALTRLDERTKAQVIHIYFSLAIHAVGRFVRIGIFCAGVWLVLNEELTIGPVIAAGVLARTGFSLIRRAMIKWREMVLAKRAYERMRSALTECRTLSVSVPMAEHSMPLILEKASYIYPQQKVNLLFSNIDLVVNPGEALFVIGPSATGKTSFARLVSGLLAPRSGVVRLGAVHVTRLQQSSLFRGIGTLLQDTSLFNGTVRENIAGMSDGDIEEAIRAAKLAGIHQTILSLPDGYDTEVSEYEPLLSSGQRKAITLARAFYGRPQLVILDEPEPHLDKPTRIALYRAIRQLKAEGTILVVTSQTRLSSKHAEKVLLLERQGQHRVCQTPEEIAALRTKKRVGKKSLKRRTQKATPTTEAQ